MKEIRVTIQIDIVERDGILYVYFPDGTYCKFFDDSTDNGMYDVLMDYLIGER